MSAATWVFAALLILFFFIIVVWALHQPGGFLHRHYSSSYLAPPLNLPQNKA